MLYEVNGKKVGVTPAKLLRAVDGDTVELQVRPTGPLVDVGFNITIGGGPVLSTWVFAKVRLVAIEKQTGFTFDDHGQTSLGVIERLADAGTYVKINTPELKGDHKQEGLNAKHRTHELLWDADLMLITPEKPKSFDRWIGAVTYRAPNGLFFCVGQRLLLEGHATAL